MDILYKEVIKQTYLIMSYFAFISYKRGGVDESVANWLHSKLEKYPYPTNLVATENRPNHEVYIRDIFIDTKDLPVNENEFTADIKKAIEDSRYLIVVCSKLSAQSIYVNREVEYFLETHNNDYDKILPVFIDTVENGLPEAIRNVNILSRHCPIYNSFLEPKNEINLYCFYHVVAYLLKVDFRSIYDRYKRYAAEKTQKIKIVKNTLIVLTVLGVVSLGYSVFSQYQLLKTKDALIEMERNVFPYSVVVGYENNFLKPVIEYLGKNDSDAHIYVHMPIHKEDIERHTDRVEETCAHLQERLRECGLDSIRPVKLKTRMKRGSTIAKFYSTSNPELNSIYIDFATTTSSFLEIAKMKKNKYAYKEGLDSMITEYTNIFIRQSKEELGADSSKVSFIIDKNEIFDRFLLKED